MIIAVELDKHDEFDRLWRYAKATLEFTAGLEPRLLPLVVRHGERHRPVHRSLRHGAVPDRAAVRAGSLGGHGRDRLRRRRDRAPGRHAPQAGPKRRHRRQRHRRVRRRHRAGVRRPRRDRGGPHPTLDRDARLLRALGAGDRRSVLDPRRRERARALEAHGERDHGPAAPVRATFDGAPVAGSGDVPARGLSRPDQPGAGPDLVRRATPGRSTRATGCSGSSRARGSTPTAAPTPSTGASSPPPTTRRSSRSTA